MKDKKLLTLVVIIGLILVLAVSSLMAACAKPAPAPAPAKPIELTYQHQLAAAPGSVPGLIADTYAKMVSERSGGRIKITTYPGGVLVAKVPEYIDATIGGLCDISTAVVIYYAARMPLTNVTQLPVPGGIVPPFGKCGDSAWQLYKKFPEIRAEWPDLKVLSLPPFSLASVHTVDKPVRRMEDLKGLKIRAPGGALGAAVKALGAIPVSGSMAELYGMLEKGVAEGATINYEGCKSVRLAELLHNHTFGVHLNHHVWFVIMSQDKWNSLPADVQKVLDECAEELVAAADKIWLDFEQEAKDFTFSGEFDPQEHIFLPPEEIARWDAVLAPIRDKWVADVEAKGLPGKKVLDEWMRLVKEQRKK